MKKQFPELTFSFDSEQMEFFTNTSMSSRYSLLHKLSSVIHGLQGRVIHKKLSTNGMFYDRYQIRKCKRVIVSLDNSSWLLWYEAPLSIFATYNLHIVPFVFSSNLDLDIIDFSTITLRSGCCQYQFDHVCSEGIQPINYEISDTHINEDRFERISFLYKYANRSIYENLKHSIYNIFWIIRSGTGHISSGTVVPYYEKYRYRKNLTSIKVSFENKTYIVSNPQRPRRTKFPGFERIPQESEIVVMQFIEGEADVLWTVSGNEIRRYG